MLRPSGLSQVCLLALCGLGGLSALIASDVVGRASRGAFALAIAAVALTITITVAEAHARSGRSLRMVAISPLALATVFWLAVFVIRPIELYYAPDHAAGTVAQLGFDLRDLTRTTALGALGAAAWCFAYLMALRHAPPRRREPGAIWRPAPISGRRAMLLLTFAAILWGTLFLRQGGPAALVDSPLSIREDQKASFYGFVGVWLTEGVAVYALAVFLRNRSAAAKRVLLVSAPLALVAAFALQLRGLAVSLLLLAAIVYLRIRRPGRRNALLAVAAVTMLVPVLAFAGQVRSYTGQLSIVDAVRTSSREPATKLFISELATFDNFVAVRQLVPSSIAHLDGRSLLEIPAAIVPRGLWKGKPDSIDERVTKIFFPDAPSGSPITMQGELYWNLGLAGVAIGGAVLGAVAGAVARFTLLVGAGGAALVVNAVAIIWMLTFLRDGLATAFANLVMALMGVGLAAFALGFPGDLSPRALLRRLAAPVARGKERADRGISP